LLVKDYEAARTLIETLKRHRHTEIARFLLSSCYDGKDIKDYDGENALHMVIAHRPKDLEMIEWLCAECPELVQGRAVGKFFCDSPYTDDRKDDTCPWGEYPLSFAAALNEPEIIKFLVQRAGADMLAQDSDGNTALHTAVKNKASESTIRLLRELWAAFVNDELRAPDKSGETFLKPLKPSNDMFPTLRWGDALSSNLDRKRVRQVALEDVVNSKGLTPIMLAATLDSKRSTEMFEILIKGEAFVRGLSWNYAHVNSWAHPLRGIDDIWDIIVRKGTLPSFKAAQSSSKTADVKNQEEIIRYQKERHAEITRSTKLRQYPYPLLTGKDSTTKREAVFSKADLAPTPKLWPRRTLLDVLADEPVSDKEGVCKLEFVKTILEKKWIMFAGGSVRISFVCTLAFLICLTGVVVLRAFDGPSSGTTQLRTTRLSDLQVIGFGRDGVCLAGSDDSAFYCELLIALECIIFLSCCESALRIARSWRRAAVEKNNVFSWLTDCHGSTFFGRFFSFTITVLVGFLTVLISINAQEHAAFHFVLSTTLVLSYLSLVRFAMGLPRLAHFVIMIKQMFTEDIMRFLGIAVIILAAFTHAFFILGRFQPSEFGLVLFRSFLALVGEGEVETENPIYGITVFQVSFLIVGSLMLLNVLIAMMGKTYERINEQAEVLATIERARLIREVEKELSPEEREDAKCWFDNRGIGFLWGTPLSFIQQDPAGLNGGTQYWVQWSKVNPLPKMVSASRRTLGTIFPLSLLTPYPRSPDF
jgi:hypothetical protein